MELLIGKIGHFYNEEEYKLEEVVREVMNGFDTEDIMEVRVLRSSGEAYIVLYSGTVHYIRKALRNVRGIRLDDFFTYGKMTDEIMLDILPLVRNRK